MAVSGELLQLHCRQPEQNCRGAEFSVGINSRSLIVADGSPAGCNKCPVFEGCRRTAVILSSMCVIATGCADRDGHSGKSSSRKTQTGNQYVDTPGVPFNDVAASNAPLDSEGLRTLTFTNAEGKTVSRQRFLGKGNLVLIITRGFALPRLLDTDVQQLKSLCPSMVKMKIAEVLARAGFHLGGTTVGRILKEHPLPWSGEFGMLARSLNRVSVPTKSRREQHLCGRRVAVKVAEPARPGTQSG